MMACAYANLSRGAACGSSEKELAASLGAHARNCSDVILVFSEELID
jgi:hypothetical protein